MKTYALTSCVISNIGKRRIKQEDNFLLCDGTILTKEEQTGFSSASDGWRTHLVRAVSEKEIPNGIFAVSDGMGGHNAGEVASRIAVEQLSGMKNYIFGKPDALSIKSRFQDYVIKANTVIAMKACQNPEYVGMGATLTGILLCGEGVLPFNLGDSRTYSFDGNVLIRLSRDHTEAQRLVDNGMIRDDEKLLVDGGKAILRYLGIDGRDMAPQAEMLEIVRIDGPMLFLVCSDGLTDLVSDEELELYLKAGLARKDIPDLARQLAEHALADKDGQPGGIDNITIMLVLIEEHAPTGSEQAKKLFGRILSHLK